MESIKIQELANLLQSEGVSELVVDTIIKDDYQEFDYADGLKDIYGQYGNYQDIIQYLADGYSMEDLPNLGVAQEKIQKFSDYLRGNNLTQENAKAINQYSSDSNMILSLKRKTTFKEDISAKIMSDLSKGLQSKRNC